MAKKRTKAQRAAAAKASWERRRKGLPPLTKPKKKSKGKARKVAVVDHPLPQVAAGHILAEAGYDTLGRELMEAFNQSAHGKGKVRHANARPFDRQPIMEIGRMVGPGYQTGQAQKKLQEAIGMLKRGETEKALAELHGAIVYTAAAAVLIREG